MTRCRILCLHGFAMRGSNRYTNNNNAHQPLVQVSAAEAKVSTTITSTRRPPIPGTCFDEYLMPLQTACPDMSFVAPSAPHRCTADVEILQRLMGPTSFSEQEYATQEHSDNYRVWWNYEDPVRSLNKASTYTANASKKTAGHRELVGLESSLEELTYMILQDDSVASSFDGILGYSQGGVAASFLCCNPTVQQKLKFAVIIAAYAELGSNAPKFSNLQHNHPIPIKSLHVWGKADRVVDPQWSKMHSQNFVKAQVYEHSAGHVIPFEDDFYRTFQEFVKSSL